MIKNWNRWLLLAAVLPMAVAVQSCSTMKKCPMFDGKKADACEVKSDCSKKPGCDANGACCKDSKACPKDDKAACPKDKKGC